MIANVLLPLLSTTNSPRADEGDGDLPGAPNAMNGRTTAMPASMAENRVIIMSFSLLFHGRINFHTAKNTAGTHNAGNCFWYPQEILDCPRIHKPPIAKQRCALLLNLLAHSFTIGARTKVAQIVKGINAGGMPVTPVHLQRVAAHQFRLLQFQRA